MVTIASQNFDALSGDTSNTDTVTDGGTLTNTASINSGGTGLDFTTTWNDTRGETTGPSVGGETGDFIGVNTFSDLNAPDVGADGTAVATNKNFQYNDGDGQLNLVLEPVDASGFENRTLSFNYWINDTGFEADDFFFITISDGVTSQTFLNFSETELEANASADDGTANWNTFTLDLEPLIAGGMDASNLNLTVSVDTNSGTENIFVDDILFEGDEAASGIVISEIMFNPASSEDDWEWVELHNPSGSAIDLAGYVLDDSNGVAHPSANIASGTIPAGGSAVLYNADDLSAADFEAAWGTGINLVAVTNWGAGQLNNGGDTVGLWSSFADYTGDNETQANALVSVTYPNIDDGAGSIYLTDLTDQDSWALSTDGTPTPVGTTITSTAAGGNSGSDIGSPGEPPALPDIVYSLFYEFDVDEQGDQATGTILLEEVVDGFLPVSDFNDANPNNLFFDEDSVVPGGTENIEVFNQFPVLGNLSNIGAFTRVSLIDFDFTDFTADDPNQMQFRIPNAVPNDGGSNIISLAADAPGQRVANLNADRGTVTLTIAEQSTYDVAPDSAALAEGDTGTTDFTFTITRSGGTTAETTVLVSTVDGTATAGSDYTALVDQVVTFGVGESTQTVTVQVNGDTDIEDDETFSLEITEASLQGIIGTASAETTITNDDFDAITIPEIQGASHVSPNVLAANGNVDVATFFATLPADTLSIFGTEVQTSGIVTAVDTNGFYLQDPTGDGNIATSDAIFVFTSSAPGVNVGDALEVQGTVTEFFPGDTDSRNIPLTQLTSPTISVTSTGNALPAPSIIGTSGRLPPSENIDDDAFASFDATTDGIDFFESLEAMLVTAEDVTAVAGTNQFGEIFGVVNDGGSASGVSSRGTLNISPDDFNPEKIQIDEDSGIFDFDFPEVNTGDLLGDVTGVVAYSFGNFEILPTVDFTGNIISAGLQPETTALVGSGDELTIATYNVLNLDPVVENPANLLPGVFNGVDDDIGDGRFEAIAQQIVNNLNAPDIIGLQEVQDNTGAEGVDSVIDATLTLQTLVDEIAAAGGPTYEFIDNPFIADDLGGGIPGGNIQTAYLYNPDRVGLSTPLSNPFDGQGGITGNGQQAGQAFNGARLPLVATFTFNGEDVHVVNNHFSSKGGSAPILGIEQPFDARQEDLTVNGSLDERQAQSQAVQDVVDGILGSDPSANVVVLGDLNEFEFVSPVEDFETDSGLTNLTNSLAEDERYSFVFQGNSQSLDHIIVSDNLASTAEVDVVHVNTEFARQDNTASDHDPIVARFTLGDAPVTPPADDFEELPLFAFADDEGGRFEVGGGSFGGLLFNFVGSDQLRITNESVNDSTPTFTTVKNYDVNNDQIILEEGVEITSVLPGFGGTTIIKFNGKGLFGLGDTLTVVSNNGFTADVLDTIVREGESDSVYEAPTPSRTVDLETGIINTFGFQSFIDFWF